MSNQQQRWKDKSEGRFSSLKSPRKSILRAADSPVRFNSPLYSQDQGQEERRVSFARDANFRLFNPTDSPNAPKFLTSMITEEMHFTDNIQNIFDENEPTGIHADVMDSPASQLRRQPESPLDFKGASESPSDRRKRRPDLFGSPSAYKSPNVKVAGTPPTLLNRVNVGDLTDYLPDLTIKRRRNIFEEDDDEDDDELRPNSMADIRDIHRAHTPTYTHKRMHLQEEEESNIYDTQDMMASQDNTQLSDMMITQERPVEDLQQQSNITQEQHVKDTQESDMILTQEQPIEYTQQSDMMITQEHDNENTQRSDMMLTQEHHVENTQQSDMLITERDSFVNEPTVENNAIQKEYYEEFRHDQGIDIPQEFTRDMESRVSPPRSPSISPLRSPLRTPARSPVRSFSFGTPPGSTVESPQRSLLGTPSGSPQRSLFGTPLGAHASPIRAPSGSPLRYQRTPTETLQKTPLGTPRRATPKTIETTQKTPLHVTPRTPTRSLYLGSPVRLSSPSSRRRMSEFSPRSLFEKSPASDRIHAVHGVHAEKSPHFYDPKDDISISQRKITLSEYLLFAGITFPNDLPVERDISDHEVQNDTTDNALKSLPILPELYLYQEACDQLIASIKKSDDIIDKIDREVSATNPQLFVELIDASVSSQMKISQQLEDIKRYSLLRSEQEWISLWTNKLKEFPAVLKEYQNVLEQYHDLQTIQAQKLEKIEKYRDELNATLHGYREKEQEFRTTDHHKLSELKQEIEIQGSFYNALKNTAKDLDDRGQQLMEEDKALDDEIKHLQEALKETELAIEKTSNITTKDLLYAKRDYELYSNLFKWKLKRNDEQMVHVEIGRGIDIMIDMIRLAQHVPNAVTWQVAASIAEDLGPIVELLHGFDIIAQNRSNPKEILQDMACYWSSVEIIKRQLDRANRRFWAKLTTLEDPFDSTMAGFVYDICLFSFQDKLRVEISFEIKVKDVFQMPSIDFSTLSLKISYGHVEHDTMKNLIIQELTENGIIGMDQSLKNIISKVADLHESE